MMIPSIRFLHAAIEGLIPEHPSETSEQRRRALDYSATFVRDQLLAMPLVLQILLACGIAVFRAVTWLRWLRSFCAMRPVKRNAWINAWAYGRVTLARKLFRPVRSLAALAYFECIG
jgi:hypothetical protein